MLTIKSWEDFTLHLQGQTLNLMMISFIVQLFKQSYIVTLFNDSSLNFSTMKLSEVFFHNNFCRV